MSQDNRAIRYLSLAKKAGRLISGADDCEKAVLKQRKKGLLALASDAGGNVERLALRLSARPGMNLLKTNCTKSEIAAAIGRGNSVALILITDEGLAGAFSSAAATAMEQEEQI